MDLSGVVRGEGKVTAGGEGKQVEGDRRRRR